MCKLLSEVPSLTGNRVTLRRLTAADAEALHELTDSEKVYKYLPAFLFEKRYDDSKHVIEHLYDECLKESLILGVYYYDEFCGLAEIYGYRPALLKVSVGYRLLERFRGQGIATETLGLLVDYLLDKTEIRFVTASVMVENKASANVLKKNGFKRVLHGVFEDWGFAKPAVTDKWIRSAAGHNGLYRFRG